MQYGRQREFLVRERTAKDGFYALSICYHYRLVEDHSVHIAVQVWLVI